MTTVTSWKAGSQCQNKESARKPQNSPGFQQLCLSVAVPDTRWNQNEPKAILQTCPFSCSHLLQDDFMLFHAILSKSPYLYRGLAFQVLQLLSMLFRSSISRWGMLCLPSKRSFEKSWNFVSRETSIWHELTFEYIWHHLTVFPIAWVWWINAQPTLLAGRQYGIASNKCVVAHLNFSKLVFELLHLTKKKTFVLSLRTSQTDHSKVVTLLCVFSAACNLDFEKSSATGHNLPVLLLLSRRWSLAVAVLLPHLRKNSVPIHRKNIQATQVKCSRNDNCDKLESRKPISKQRKRQKAPEFAWISATLSFSCCTWYEAEPKKTRGNTTDLSVLICCKTISCYFMLFCQRAPYLYRGLAFQVLQLLSMLFSSSSSRWGILCLPSKRSFEKSWNIVSRETSNWHELTFNTIWLSFQLLEFGG